MAGEEGILDLITLTVEAGGIGGIPAGGLSFGATTNADAIVDQPYQFDFYDGGGLHQAFLGMAQADAAGSVNVSRFGTRIAGPGGFINISQSAREVYFLGLFRAGATLAVADGGIRVVEEGPGCKFLDRVEQVTFSGEQARDRGQTVHFVTERCVLRLTDAGLALVEIVPGLDLQEHVLGAMAFRPRIADDLTTMEPALFRPEAMGLAHRPPLPLGDRFPYDPEQNILYCNFEGLTLSTADEAAELAEHLDARFRSIGRRVHVIVNYDNFEVLPPASARFFAMVEHNGRYSLSRTRYSANAFFRRRLGARFTAASLDHRLYGSFAEARAGIPNDGRGAPTSEAATTPPFGESRSQSGADRS